VVSEQVEVLDAEVRFSLSCFSQSSNVSCWSTILPISGPPVLVTMHLQYRRYLHLCRRCTSQPATDILGQVRHRAPSSEIGKQGMPPGALVSPLLFMGWARGLATSANLTTNHLQWVWNPLKLLSACLLLGRGRRSPALSIPGPVATPSILTIPCTESPSVMIGTFLFSLSWAPRNLFNTYSRLWRCSWNVRLAKMTLSRFYRQAS
jgi:hypothetical protein